MLWEMVSKALLKSRRNIYSLSFIYYMDCLVTEEDEVIQTGLAFHIMLTGPNNVLVQCMLHGGT